MTTRAALVAAVLLGAAGAVQGCARSGPPPEQPAAGAAAEDEPPPPPPPDLLSLLPRDAFAVVRADLVQLRETPHYGALVDSLRQMSGELQDVPVDLFGILDRTDELVLGFSLARGQDRLSDDADYFLFLRGRYLEGELESTLRAVVDAEGRSDLVAGSVASRELGELGVFLLEGVALTSLGTHTWLAARPQALEGIVARLDAADVGLGPASGEAFEVLAGSVGFRQAPIAGVLTATDTFRESLLQGMGAAAQQGGLESALLQAFVGAAARIDLEQEIRLSGLVETTNSLVAAAAADLVEERIESLRAAPSMAGVISDHSIVLEGRRARISITVDADALQALLGNVAALFDVAERLDDAGSDGAGPPPSGRGDVQPEQEQTAP